MHGVLFANMLDAEIVKDESEVKWTGVMAPEGRRVWRGKVWWGGAPAMLRKMLGERVVGNAAGLMFNPGFPFQISMWIQPSAVASDLRSCLLMILAGILEMCVFMCSNVDMGAPQ